MSLADENPNGKISWSEFIPHGITAIQVFLERNRVLAKTEPAKTVMKPDLLKTLFEHEVNKAAQIMRKRFE